MKLFAGILLALSFTNVQAQLPSIGDLFGNLNIPHAGEIYSSKECSDEVRSDSGCNVAPFTGVFVCRQYFSLFGLYTSEHTLCARNVAPGVTLALSGDTCGCCDGECKQPCQCYCGDPDESGAYSSQLVRPVIFGASNGPPVCVPNGVANHMTNWGGRMICDEDCSSGEGGGGATAAPTV
ncbi:expressed unknown protein [Seminavis robusta]|uniref:Uncharacterized protein n=1 Tax=Seminavis robusta TaxID=568900 RepID=A0A9N8DSP8_9STRA|nr:expressed unknown protein [Seminavis robusta]|eukprot:Sro324_g117450.1 n/a (180) ;mRNA; f:4810-5349